MLDNFTSPGGCLLCARQNAVLRDDCTASTYKYFMRTSDEVFDALNYFREQTSFVVSSQTPRWQITCLRARRFLRSFSVLVRLKLRSVLDSFCVLHYATSLQSWLVHTADTDKARLSCLVLSASAVWTELATSQDCRWLKISKQFCPVSKCSVNWVSSCPDPVSNSHAMWLPIVTSYFWKLGQD